MQPISVVSLALLCVEVIAAFSLYSPLNSTGIQLAEDFVRRPLECKDNRACRKWRKRGFCRSRKFNEGTKALLCPVACGFCGSRKKRPAKGRKRPPPPTPRRPQPPRPQPKPAEARFPAFQQCFDESADPCQSFHQFSCGKLLRDFPANLPGERFGPSIDLEKQLMEKHQRDIFAESPSTAVKMMQTYYRKCMDKKSIEALKTTELREVIKKMGSCPTLEGAAWDPAKFDLTQTLIEMSRAIGKQQVFGIIAYRPETMAAVLPSIRAPKMVSQSPYFYFKPEFAPKIAAMHSFITDAFGYVAQDSLSTRTYKEISESVTQIVEFEKKVAAIAIKYADYRPTESKEVRDDKIRFNDLQRILSGVDWDRYVKGNPIFNDEIRKYLLSNPEFMLNTEQLYTELNALMLATDKGLVADYLVSIYIVAHTEAMDSRFRASTKRFGEVISGIPSPPKDAHTDCFEAATEKFDFASDFVFLQKGITQSTLDKAAEMVEDLRSSLLEMIQKEDWMDDQTKTKATQKVRATKSIIGGNSLTRNQAQLDAYYSKISLDPSDSYMTMDIKLQTYETQQNLMTCIQGMDSWKEQMLAHGGTVYPNAFNELKINYIKMNAGILQSPFFSADLPASVNYGALGTVVGHEFSHGIDPNGAKFDENGVKNNWWDAQTLNQFQSKAKCLVDLYGAKTEPKSGLKVNGQITVGENTADHAGIRAAYAAYQRHLKRSGDKPVPGYAKYTNDQLFFMSFAMFFCNSKSAQEMEQQLQNDDHAPDELRVDLTLSQFPEFAKAFKCRAGTPMNPTSRCSIW